MLGVGPCSSINVRMRIVHRPSIQKTTGRVEVHRRGARWLPPRRRPDRLCDVGPATPAIELEGDQLGVLNHSLAESQQFATSDRQLHAACFQRWAFDTRIIRIYASVSCVLGAWWATLPYAIRSPADAGCPQRHSQR